MPMQYVIENIHFLLNMAFISSSEVENVYTNNIKLSF